MEVMKRWFHTLDADGSGSIGPEELEDPLVSVGLAATHQVRDARSVTRGEGCVRCSL